MGGLFCLRVFFLLLIVLFVVFHFNFFHGWPTRESFQFDLNKSLHNNDSQVVLICSHRPRLLGNLIYLYCVIKENMYLKFACLFSLFREKQKKIEV